MKWSLFRWKTAKRSQQRDHSHLLFVRICWTQTRLSFCSKNFPTYAWNIPKRPPFPTVYVSEFLAFGGERGILGYAKQGYVGVPLDLSKFLPSSPGTATIRTSQTIIPKNKQSTINSFPISTKHALLEKRICLFNKIKENGPISRSYPISYNMVPNVTRYTWNPKHPVFNGWKW